MIRNAPEDFLPPIEQLYGIYRGVVEDNNDPEKAGRCRVRVFGVHSELKIKTIFEGIPVEELLWAEPAMGLIEGSISGFGMWSIPVQGSHVFVFFENGNPMQPRYFATVPGIPTTAPEAADSKTKFGFQDPDGVYPIAAAVPPLEPNELNEPDVHKLARGEIQFTIVNEKKDRRIEDIETADGNTWNEPLPYYDAQYPENIVLATHGGIVVELDNTVQEGAVDPVTGEQGAEVGKRRVHIYHPSHTFIDVSEEGDISFRNERDRFEIITRNRKIYIMANEDRTINENQTQFIKKDKTEKIGRHEVKTVEKDYTLNVGNEMTEDVGADKSVTVANDMSENIGRNLEIIVGNNVTITAGGTVTVTGSQISLN